jgi:hypothetical protein
MIDAARNWMDNLQATAPGYRDRIVHVFLSKKEGGLNLNMPADVLKALTGYGEQAAEHLIEHFIDGTENGKPTPMTWNNHRWIRYRSTTALLQQFLSDYAFSMEHPEPKDFDMMTLVKRGQNDLPNTGYRFLPEQREFAIEITVNLKTLGDGIAATDLAECGPKPPPALRVRPKF